MTEHDASRGHNGTTHHPILDRPAPRPEPLPPRLSPPRTSEERAEAYASLALQQQAVQETTFHELDEMRSAVIILDGRVFGLRANIREDIREALQEAMRLPKSGRALPPSERDTLPPPDGAHPTLPPMRDRAQSVLELVERVGGTVDTKLSQSFTKMAKESAGPGVNKTPEELVAIAKQIAMQTVQDELQERAERQAVEQERAELAAFKAADLERRKAAADAIVARRETRKKWWATVSASLFVGFVFWLSAFLYGRATGHDAGVVEGKASAPTVVVPMPIATIPSAAPTVLTWDAAPVTTAPAAAAPAKKH